MANRILKGAVFAGLVLASAGNAENCKEAVLYDGSNYNGQMEESGRTFPEAPEWTEIKWPTGITFSKNEQ